MAQVPTAAPPVKDSADASRANIKRRCEPAVPGTDRPQGGEAKTYPPFECGWLEFNGTNSGPTRFVELASRVSAMMLQARPDPTLCPNCTDD
jgi:hypothetical protein